jgi:hypothetical protein
MKIWLETKSRQSDSTAILPLKKAGRNHTFGDAPWWFVSRLLKKGCFLESRRTETLGFLHVFPRKMTSQHPVSLRDNSYFQHRRHQYGLPRIQELFQPGNVALELILPIDPVAVVSMLQSL